MSQVFTIKLVVFFEMALHEVEMVMDIGVRQLSIKYCNLDCSKEGVILFVRISLKRGEC